MTTENETPEPIARRVKKGFSGLQVLGIVVGTIFVTALITGFVVWRWIFPPPFDAVELDAREEAVLEAKLGQLGIAADVGSDAALEPRGENQFDESGALVPERYSEAGASREVRFSEREVNGLLANNTNLADRLAIDLSENLASAKLLIPMEPDFPVLGGKTIRVTAGVEVAFREQRPVVRLLGVSVMGIPMPSAWLGNLKNVDLVSEFGGDPGLWRSIAAGIEYVEVREGDFVVKLRE